MTSLHPYYPPDLVLEGYTANTRSQFELIGAWLGSLSLVTIATLVWLAPRRLTWAERLTTLWFVTCGCIHVFFEGHFVRNHRILATLTDFISQEWKEYAKSDSRYLRSDPFVLAVETITVTVLGPLCFYIAVATAYRFPSRFVWTALMCLAHIYGNALYYSTTIIQQCPDSRPEFLYFWVYFVGLNALWLITPFALLVHSIRRINAAIRQMEFKESTKKNS